MMTNDKQPYRVGEFVANGHNVSKISSVEGTAVVIASVTGFAGITSDRIAAALNREGDYEREHARVAILLERLDDRNKAGEALAARLEEVVVHFEEDRHPEHCALQSDSFLTEARDALRLWEGQHDSN